MLMLMLMLLFRSMFLRVHIPVLLSLDKLS